MLERLTRRINLLIGRGRATYIDDTGPVQTMQCQCSAIEMRQALRVAEFGFASNPPLGSDAVLVFIGGDRTNAIVVGTNHQASRLRNLAAGETALYDEPGKYVKLGAAGIVIEAGGRPVTVQNASSITLTAPTINLDGNVAVSGSLVATGNVTGAAISLDSHVHTGVQTGGGNTGGPV